jgi:ABC-type multidrug transport system fused ATPase/permease subunit
MEFSVDAVANKMIIAVVALSALMSAIGFVIFANLSGNEDPSALFGIIMGVDARTVLPADGIPFATGIGMVMCLNIAKVLLMKRAVNNAVNRDVGNAKLYMQGQYFLRLVLTATVLFVAGYLHSSVTNDVGNPQYVNFMGSFFGIFSFRLATYSMRFFLRHELEDNPLPTDSKSTTKNAIQSAIGDLKAIGNTVSEETQEVDSKKQ